MVWRAAFEAADLEIDEVMTAIMCDFAGDGYGPLGSLMTVFLCLTLGLGCFVFD